MKHFLLIPFLFLSTAMADTIRTNSAYIHNAPKWMKQTELNSIFERIEKELEWRTRRINIYYHDTDESYAKTSKISASTKAVTIKSEVKQEVHLSPKVTKDTYKITLAHEMVHVIFFQKYRGAIPIWLEEGFANHLARKDPVNYKWLSEQELPDDITKMTHPFSALAEIPSSIHYATSQAIVEMLNKKCNMENLLRLSVERQMKDYIKTYCGISDINATFKEWVKSKAASAKN